MNGEKRNAERPEYAEGSLAEKLFRLQHEIDRETEVQRAENALPFRCKEGCAECCEMCHMVSETEFAQILDSLIRNHKKEDLRRIIETARKQWDLLRTESPVLARLLSGPAALKDLFALRQRKLPFPCLLLDDRQCCSVYEVRPLACRLHGTAFTGPMPDEKPCSLLPQIAPACDWYADLSSYHERILSFFLLRCGDRLIVRRPAPLFYYFYLIFGDAGKAGRAGEEDAGNIEFCRDLFALSENAYIEKLKASVSTDQ